MGTPSSAWNQSFVTNMSATTGPAHKCLNYMLSSAIVAVLLEILSIYLVTTLAIFSWRTRNRRDVSKLNRLCSLSALIAFLLCTSNLYALLLEDTFNALDYIEAVCYWLGICLTYTVLWARQRRFYSNKLLANKVGKCHRILSSAVIIAICVCLGALVFTFVSKTYGRTCATSYDINDILPILVAYIAAAFVFQMLLFYLLVNPLRSEDGVKTSDILRFRLKKDIHKMVVRLAICAAVCIITTTMTSGMIFLVLKEIVETSWYNVVTLDLIGNTISMVCSFKSWKTRLFPFCKPIDLKLGNSDGENEQISFRSENV
ncbi:uncharacterized protein LOC143462527 [Clavelina lepadiformis]|uniref:uncharacterized protein LOC143462527 n=1 Tax=Clavelina lepadiformis TaxID=159417 RepID=UPI00404244F9